MVKLKKYLTFVKLSREPDIRQQLVQFPEHAVLLRGRGLDVPDLDEVVLLPGRDGEPKNVVTVDANVAELLADRGDQQLFPDARLKAGKPHMHKLVRYISAL